TLQGRVDRLQTTHHSARSSLPLLSPFCFAKDHDRALTTSNAVSGAGDKSCGVTYLGLAKSPDVMISTLKSLSVACYLSRWPSRWMACSDSWCSARSLFSYPQSYGLLRRSE